MEFFSFLFFSFFSSQSNSGNQWPGKDSQVSTTLLQLAKMNPGECNASEIDTRQESSEQMNEKYEKHELGNSERTDRQSLSAISKSTSSSRSNGYGSELHTLRSWPTEHLECCWVRMSDALSRIETQRYQHALTVKVSDPSPLELPCLFLGAESPIHHPCQLERSMSWNSTGQMTCCIPRIGR